VDLVEKNFLIDVNFFFFYICQLANQSRPTMPTFIAAVAATSGEVGIETVKLQEFLTMAYAKKLAREGDRDDAREGDRDDGLSTIGTDSAIEFK